MRAPDHLYIAWAKRRAFLDAYDSEGPGRYTVQSPRPGAFPASAVAGELVPVELEFLDGDRRFRHTARVVARESGPPESITLEFLPEEAEVRDLVLCHAGGESVPYLHRRSERNAVWLPVVVQVEDVWRRAIATDLSELGAFVSLANPPAQGGLVILGLVVGDERIDVAARVVHVKEDSATTTGCGLEFVFADRDQEILVRQWIRAVVQRMSR